MNKKIAMFSAFAVVAIPFAPAFAADTTIDPATAVPQTLMNQQVVNSQARTDMQAQRQQIQTERAGLSEQRQQNMQDRCKNIQTKIETQTNRYDNGRKMFLTVFGNMQARLTRLSERLASKGIDVTKLNGDIATLSGKIAKLTTDHDVFVAGLKDAQTTAATDCQTTPGGNFMGKLLGARKVSLTVQQDRLDIRSFFQTTIRPDVMAIRKQLESQKEATTTTPETEKSATATPDATK